MSGAKQRLSIKRWDVASKQVKGGVFTVMLNPAGYQRDVASSYSEGERKRLDSVMPEGLKLDDLVFDGTGIINPDKGTPMDVDTQLAKLKAVLYGAPAGDTVKRPVVQLSWGSLYFLGRIEHMKVKYTLFKPNGQPLRARVSLKFVEFDEEYERKRADAVDEAIMTRQIEVKAGDTLPLLCFNAYQDPGRAQAVARANGLTSFRNVPPGQQLAFGPVNNG
jgi:hypothetical protein